MTFVSMSSTRCRPELVPTRQPGAPTGSTHPSSRWGSRWAVGGPRRCSCPRPPPGRDQPDVSRRWRRCQITFRSLALLASAEESVPIVTDGELVMLMPAAWLARGQARRRHCRCPDRRSCFLSPAFTTATPRWPLPGITFRSLASLAPEPRRCRCGGSRWRCSSRRRRVRDRRHTVGATPM